MKITAIKAQVKKIERVSIFIDEKYKFSLSAIELSNLGLFVGQEMTASDINNLDRESKASLAKNNSLRFLSYRLRSVWEVDSYLKRKKYDQETIDKTMKFLADKNFINDRQFARQWVENRLLLKQVSIRQLRQELRLKHVVNEIIESVIQAQNIDEVDILRKLIDKKREQTKYKDDLKLLQFLSRRGYSYEKIQIALGRRTG